VTNRGNQNALQAYLTQAIAALQDGEVDEARKKLTKTPRADRWLRSPENPRWDGQDRDWVTDCAPRRSCTPY